ncbi:MAG: YqcC family protein [Gammaproteobacteria bacterium]|jgi:uncharacterized protein YqcC (DUF446 family)
MDSYDREISEALLAIEAELRCLSLWESAPPPAADLLSDQPFCCDTLDFPQWAQWILLPRMWDIVRQSGPYPTRCGIYDYAEEWSMHQDADCLALLNLIKRFDALVESRSMGRRH